MENQENCVIIVNNVIAKIKEISKKVSSDETYENDNINKLDELINTFINEKQDKDSKITSLENELTTERNRANECATKLNDLDTASKDKQEKLGKKITEMQQAMEDATNKNALEIKEVQDKILEMKKAKNAADQEVIVANNKLTEKQNEFETASDDLKEKIKKDLLKAKEEADLKFNNAEAEAKRLADEQKNLYDKELAGLTNNLKILNQKNKEQTKLISEKDSSINFLEEQLSSKDDELFAMKGKNLELMKQYYGKHLAFKEIFTELNNKVTKTKESAQSTKLKSIEEPRLSKELIKKRIVEKQNGVIVKYSTEQLNSLKDIKERINAINKRIQVLKEAKTREPQTEEDKPQTEGVAGGGDNQKELEKINEISEISDLQNLLKINEEEFIKLNNDNNLLKPDESDQLAQRENLNELTKQHWISKDDYDDITTFANNMIKMYNGSIAENESLKTSSSQSDGQLRKTINTLNDQITNLQLDLESKNNDLNSKNKELYLANTKHKETIQAINSMLELKLDYDNFNEDVDTEKVDQKKLEEQIEKFNKDVEIINNNSKTTIPDYEAVDQPVIDKLRNKLIELNEIRKKFNQKAILNNEQREELKSYEKKINKFVKVMFGDGSEENIGFLLEGIEDQTKIINGLEILKQWQNQSIDLLEGKKINDPIEPPNLSLLDLELEFDKADNKMKRKKYINGSENSSGIEIGIYAMYSAIKSFTNVVFEKEASNRTIEEKFKPELYQKTNFNLKDLEDAIKTTHEKLTERNEDLGIFNQRKDEINKKILALTEQMIECSKKDTSFKSVGSSLQTALNTINNNNKKLNNNNKKLNEKKNSLVPEYDDISVDSSDGSSKQGGKLKRSLNINTKIKRSLKKRK